MRVGVAEGRVLGSLVEKQLTTPQQYPLTLNALVAACNQASNRDPVVDYDESVVESALEALKERELVRFVLPSHGRSVVRYRHVLDETLGLDPARLALLAVLLLRGPQTPGELRARTERMAQSEGTDAVERELAALEAHDEGLVARVGRRPGQKEDRFAEQLTGGANAPSGDPVRAAEVDGVEVADRAPVGLSAPVAPAVLEQLRAEMAEISSSVDELRAALDALRSSLGG
jgi:hypothetical protein